MSCQHTSILSSNLPLFHRLLCYKIAITLFSKTKRQIRRVEARYILYSRMEKSFLSQNTRAGNDLKSSGTIIIFRKKKKTTRRTVGKRLEIKRKKKNQLVDINSR